MFDISFFTVCNDFTPEVISSIEQIILLFEFSRDVEIVILNSAIDCSINKMLSKYEKEWPENILIVNTDHLSDEDTIINMGIDYSDSLCYIYFSLPIKSITPSLFDMAVRSEKCDIDKYKYIKDKYKYISMCFGQNSFIYNQANEYPILSDYRNPAGAIDLHYFYQDIYVAKKMLAKCVNHVYDIGSRIDGYISHLLAMNIKVTMIDIRPLPYKIDNLDFMEGDAMNLENLKAGSIPILSCLHALEHFGLGRYGDPLDHDGWRKALTAFKRVVEINGFLYLSVPVGKHETVMFNAHRIFDPMTIIDNLQPTFKLIEFTLLHGDEQTTFDFDHNKSYNEICNLFCDIRKSYLDTYDCGIFIFQKI